MAAPPRPPSPARRARRPRSASSAGAGAAPAGEPAIGPDDIAWPWVDPPGDGGDPAGASGGEAAGAQPPAERRPRREDEPRGRWRVDWPALAAAIAAGRQATVPAAVAAAPAVPRPCTCGEWLAPHFPDELRANCHACGREMHRGCLDPDAAGVHCRRCAAHAGDGVRLGTLVEKVQERLHRRGEACKDPATQAALRQTLLAPPFNGRAEVEAAVEWNRYMGTVALVVPADTPGLVVPLLWRKMDDPPPEVTEDTVDAIVAPAAALLDYALPLVTAARAALARVRVVLVAPAEVTWDAAPVLLDVSADVVLPARAFAEPANPAAAKRDDALWNLLAWLHPPLRPFYTPDQLAKAYHIGNGQLSEASASAVLALDDLAQQPPELLPVLHPVQLPFQRRALTWMLMREGARPWPASVGTVHPLWQHVELPSGASFWVNRWTAALSATPPARTPQSRGGILAEEMGLGKTVELLGLILMHPRPPLDPERDGVDERGYFSPLDGGYGGDDTLPKLAVKTTLIVSPSSILYQWRDEIRLHTPQLSVYIYEGAKKDANISAEEFGQYDIILTTYEVLRAEVHYARPPPARPRRYDTKYSRALSPLIKVGFWRVCLDEAQMLEMATNQVAEMALRLFTVNRWVITGTPIGRFGVHDLYGLCLFVQQFPLASQETFRLYQSAAARRGPLGWHKSALFHLLREFMWRSTRREVASELALPPQTSETITLKMTPLERYHYTQLYNYCIDLLQARQNEGTAGPAGGPSRAPPPHALVPAGRSSNMPTAVDNAVRRLRQACCHPQVGEQNRSVFGQETRTMEQVLSVLRRQSYSELGNLRRQVLGLRVKQGMMLELMKDFNGALAVYDPALREAELFTQEARAKLAAYLPHMESAAPEASGAHAADQTKTALKTEAAKADAAPAGAPTTTAMHADPPTRADAVGRRRVPHTSVTTAAGFATVVQQATALAAALAADRDDDDDDGDQSRTHGESGSAADEGAAGGTKHSRGGRKALTPEEQDVREWRRNLSDQLRQWLETLHRIQFVRASVHLEQGLEEQANREFDDAERVRVELMAVAEKTIADMLAKAREERARADANELLAEQRPPPNMEAFRGGLTGATTYLTVRETLAMLTTQRRELLAARKRILDALMSDIHQNYEEDAKRQDETDKALTAYFEELDRRRLVVTGQASHRIKLRPHETMTDLINASLQTMQRQLRRLLDQRLLLAASLPTGSRTYVEDQETNILRYAVAELDDVLEDELELLKVLESERRLLSPLANARINYYRQLQRLSDNVKMLEMLPEHASLQLPTVAAQIDEQAKSVEALAGRVRYLDHLASADADFDKTCGICRGELAQPSVLTQCGHVYCRECLMHWFRRSHTCPVCHTRITRSQQLLLFSNETDGAPGSVTVHRGAMDFGPASATVATDAADRTVHPALDRYWRTQRTVVQGSWGSKLDAIVRYLLYLRVHEPDAKSLVFSQWDDVLNILAAALERNQITYVRLDAKLRQQAILRFRTDPDVKVFMLNAANQSSGLTLVAATHVFLVEPLMNPAVELQAIGRVHRIGQTRPTVVHRIVLEDSIEERILRISADRMRASGGDASMVGLDQRNAVEVLQPGDYRLLFEDLNEPGAIARPLPLEQEAQQDEQRALHAMAAESRRW